MGAGASPNVRSVTRFEWERIIRSVRWRGVVSGGGGIDAKGRRTRGDVSPQAVRDISFTFAQAGNADGSQVWPGDLTVSIWSEADIKLVKAVREALIFYNLLTFVRARSRREGGGDEYRLTCPDDLMDRLTVWGPLEMRRAADEHRAKERARKEKAAAKRAQRTGSDGPGTADQVDAVPGPMDPVQPPAGDAVPGPADPVQPVESTRRTGSNGLPDSARTGSVGPAKPGPTDRSTKGDHPPTPTNPGSGVRTGLAVVGDSPPLEDPILKLAEGEPDPDGCKPHKIPPGLRCPACARGLKAPPPPDLYDHEADNARDLVAKNRAAWDARVAKADALRGQRTIDRPAAGRMAPVTRLADRRRPATGGEPAS